MKSKLEEFVGQPLDKESIDCNNCINSSVDNKGVLELRQKNAEDLYSQFFKNNIDTSEIFGADSELVSERLKLKIIDYLRDRCAGYY